ncbi:hypothetical protein OZX61_02190 [Acinetobacter sp. ESL0695]|uniref:hypothetical protein n=1 Tax=Acinetobacter sp. ESL0695 TaxID=2983215 RepID=UPI0023F2B3C1|nr:hypothetical protein [Acinetobacter sp. ESL0695]WEV49319.1 hypothetical protein OZX61_02190 [Acinetobacter sp. ESL0695]
MKTQLNMLNELSTILNFCSVADYDSAYLKYMFNPNEGWKSMTLSSIKNGKAYLPSDYESTKVIALCKQLHNVMQQHTGGDWRKFILTIDRNREVKTQFIYDIQSCMDEFKD